MSDMNRPRRLPWKGPEGQDAYVMGGGPLSRLADATEAKLVDDARRVARYALDVLEEYRDDHHPAVHTAQRLVECLNAAILVADLRGERLGLGDADPGLVVVEEDGGQGWPDRADT